MKHTFKDIEDTVKILEDRVHLLNKKINSLIVLKYLGVRIFKNLSRGHYWLCKCDCGKEWPVLENNILTGRVKSCGCGKFKKQKFHSSWKGYQDIGRKYWNQCINKAHMRNLEFNISIEYAWNLFIQQNKKCALSGIDIGFDAWKKNQSAQTASLDRIDSSKGYIERKCTMVT